MSTIAPFIEGFDHIALEVTDLEEGIRFFGDTLGFKERFRMSFDDFEIVMFKAGKIDLEMWQRKRAEAEAQEDPAASATVHHLAFAVKDLDRALNGIRALGIPVLAGAYAPTRGIREAIIEGPDGLRVQLVEQNVPLLIWRSLRGDFKKHDRDSTENS